MNNDSIEKDEGSGSKVAFRGSSPVILSLLLGNWLSYFMIFSACLAWSATPVILARGVGITMLLHQIIIGVAGLCLLVAMFAFLYRSSHTHRLIDFVADWQPPSLGTIMLIGLLFRVLWILFFLSTPISDGATYLQLAQRLLVDGTYEIAGTRAYWPPGYPFFLVPWLGVFPDKLVIPLSQLTLFLFGAWGCYRLAAHFCGSDAGKLAALIFALWPNLVAITGAAEKETLIIAILPWVCIGVLSKNTVPKVLSGIGLGFATLVQPSLQFLIPTFGLLIPLIHGRKKIVSSFLFIIFAALVIGPWTIRNYSIFEDFVFISTNGGSVLYRANNPLASGGYTPVGEVDVSHLGELAMDKESKRLAIVWIKKNPVDFLELAIEKQFRFMGDDSAGVYSSIRHGDEESKIGKLIYIFAKLGANTWWMATWFVIVFLAIKNRRHGNESYRLVVWCWIYLFVLHSIFESDGKYHVPMLWVLCVWLACSLKKRLPGKII